MKLRPFIHKWRWPLGILFAGSLAVAIGGPFVSDLTNPWWEVKARRWTPGPADLMRPPEALIAKDVDISGDWSRSGMDTVGFSFRPRPDGGYDVDGGTGGCLDRWTFQRTATCLDGVIKLDRPIAEYRPVVYDTLYVVRYDGGEYLLPACSVSDFNQWTAQGQGIRASWVALTRNEPPHAQ
jgi:hypothetical protein